MPDLSFFRKIIATLALAAFCVAVWAQKPVSENDLRLNVAFLADSCCAGRGCGTVGTVEASAWIARQFADAGLQQLNGSWFQHFETSSGTGHNVIGVLPGSNHSYILVGAHYDGLGTIGGRMYPGADSNASGVAALLSIAAAMPRDIGTGLIFVAFDAYASSRSGAAAFLEAFPQLNITTMISLDILGGVTAPVRSGEYNYLLALGAKGYAGSLTLAGFGLDVNLYYDYYGSEEFTRIFYNRIGDQVPFQKKGVATIVFTSGITMNTNKPADSPRALNYGVFTRRVKLIQRWLVAKTALR